MRIRKKTMICKIFSAEIQIPNLMIQIVVHNQQEKDMKRRKVRQDVMRCCW